MTYAFRRISTNEWSGDLLECARYRFRGQAHVVRIRGASARMLASILGRLTEPALVWLAQLLADPMSWVCFDDPERCPRTCGAFPGEVRIADSPVHRRVNPIKELFRMCQCHSVVIVNGAFLRCGAWLGSSVAKRVLTPDRRDNRGFVAMADLIPAGWERIGW
jgi:hypothetical protein